MSTVQRGPATIRFRGRTIRRDHGFIELDDLTCPDHHKMRRGGATIRGDGALTCTNHGRHPGADRPGECGALMWVLHVPATRYQQRFYVADVTFEELALWEQRGYEAEDVLRYLGAWFSRAGDAPADHALHRKP